MRKKLGVILTGVFVATILGTLAGNVLAAGETINYFCWQGQEQEGLKQLAPEFEKRTGIKVVFHDTFHLSLYEQLSLSLASRSGMYDVVVLLCYWSAKMLHPDLGYGTGGFFYPLTEFLAKEDPKKIGLDDMPQNVQEWASVGDDLYGIPWVISPQVFMANKDMLAEAGIAGIPETITEWIDYSKKLQKDTDGDGEIDQYANSMPARKSFEIVDDFGKFMLSEGGDWFDENWVPTANSASGIRALEEYVTLLGYSAPGSLGYDTSEAAVVFHQGNSAFLCMWPDYAAAAEDPKKSQVAGHVVYGPFPKGEPDKYVTLEGAWVFAIPKDAPHKEAAWEWIKFASSAEWVPFLADYGVNPTRLSYLKNFDLLKKYPFYAGIEKIYAEGDIRNNPGTYFERWPECSTIAELYISLALTGKMSPTEALNQTVKEMNEELKD